MTLIKYPRELNESRNENKNVVNKPMNILVACEESQIVTKNLREREHNAYSCDIQDCSGGHNEWHIKADVVSLLNGNCTFTTADGVEHTIEGRWDMIIAFPPCTHLSLAGSIHFESKRKDGRQREGIEFFTNFLNADCDKIAIENPKGILSGEYIKQYFPDLCEKYGFPIKPTQIIEPWYFNDCYKKPTCLWLKGLPKLKPNTLQVPELEYFEWISKHGIYRRASKWMYNALKLPPEERSRVRSKTFPGVARAMAKQWTPIVRRENE